LKNSNSPFLGISLHRARGQLAAPTGRSVRLRVNGDNIMPRLDEGLQ